MALILRKKSSFRRWYEANKESLSQKRKKRYAEDSEYRQRAIEASRRRNRGERTVITPPADSPISFAQAAERLGVSVPTLHAWHKKEYFPEPKRQNGRLWFNEKQVLLLIKLKDVIGKYGKRRGTAKWDQLKAVTAFIGAHWD